jgi:hypothetical protein
MEPLKPSYREALKKEHPKLTDETIDLSEELISQRFLIDPEKEPQRIKELDQRRAELIQREMPRFEEVIQRVRKREIPALRQPTDDAEDTRHPSLLERIIRFILKLLRGTEKSGR